MSRTKYVHIAAVIDAGGQIMLGTVKPLAHAAVAHDGKTTLAMLRQRPKEPVEELLGRLDLAIAEARKSGQRVDEINNPDAAVRYEI
jgi:hypothetical protein